MKKFRTEHLKEAGNRSGNAFRPLGLELCCLMVFLLLSTAGSQASQIAPVTVTGIVTDQEEGLPLPGLTVLVKGTTTATVTDADGHYSILVPGPNSALVFSFIGYKTREIPVGDQTQINVVMELDLVSLDEVVVVGYGTQERGNLTGAVAVAEGDVLQERPIINITDGLQGVVPGLNITPSSGTPGAQASINIRGATSINGGEPLVLVDGAMLDLNTVNPQDIASVTVLKDASSAAIYGARAAFGVILITTKKGARNTEPQLQYSGNVFVAQPTILPTTSGSYRYAQYVNSMVGSTNAARVFTDAHLALIRDRVDGAIANDYTLKPSGTAYFEHANTDWADLVFGKAAPGQNHNLSLSGGTDKTAYRASFAYARQEGIVKVGNDLYERFNFNTNMSTDLNKWLTARFQVNFSKSEQDLHNLPPGHGPSIFHTVWRARPTLTPYIDLEGVPYSTFIRLNPVATLAEGGRENRTKYNMNTKAGIEMKFGDFQVFSNFTYNPRFHQAIWNNVDFESITPWANLNIRNDGGPSYVRKLNQVANYYAFDIYGKYGKEWNSGHSFETTVGFNQEKAMTSDDQLYNTDLISYDVVSISNTLGDPTVTDHYTDWALRSGFARLNYNYLGKYLVELNGRYDGSSRFSRNNRFGFFPSVSAGWRVSDENFMKDLSWLNLFKLRASYGALGNQNSSVLYPYVGYLSLPQTNWIINGARPLGLRPMDPIAASRTWERVTTTNFGADVVMLEGRLDATLDIFTRNTKDMLVQGDALPGVFGAAAPQKNSADLQVKGWEASIGWKGGKASGLSYNLNVVISDSKGEITRFDNPTRSLARSYYEGMAIGEIWGYETEGLFQSQEEISQAADHAPLGGGNLIAPGDVHYADLNGDGVINTGENTVDNPGDRRIIGNASPRYLYGIRGGVNWKGIDLSVFFQGVGKRDYWLDGPMMFGGVGGYGNAIVTDYLYENTWSDGSDGFAVNSDAYYFRPSQGAVVSRNTGVQTRYLQNASFLRLKNLTIGYSFAKPMLNSWGIENLRVFLSGENLLTFTELNQNFDPETLSPGQGALGNTSFNGGGDQSGKLYPLSRRISFGLTLGF